MEYMMNAMVRGFCLGCLLGVMGCASSSSSEKPSPARYQVERVPALGASAGEQQSGNTARDRLAELRGRLKSRTSRSRVEQNDTPVISSASVSTTARDSSLAGGMYVIQVGDPVVVTLRGVPGGEQISEIVDSTGMITLTFIGDIKAAGLTSPQLERRIRDVYISKQIYNDVTVNVSTPVQSYFMRGEIKKPSRYNLVNRTTLGQAIAAAGGYTEYANLKRIKIVRDGKTYKYNMREIEKNPEKDPEIRSGDVVIIERSMF